MSEGRVQKIGIRGQKTGIRGQRTDDRRLRAGDRFIVAECGIGKNAEGGIENWEFGRAESMGLRGPILGLGSNIGHGSFVGWVNLSFVGFRSSTQPTCQPFLCYQRNPTK